MTSEALRRALLLVAFHQSLTADDSEAGIALLVEAAGDSISADAWRDTVAAAVADGLLQDPVRLRQGALQCHWHLALTPDGVEAARAASAA